VEWWLGGEPLGSMGGEEYLWTLGRRVALYSRLGHCRLTPTQRLELSGKTAMHHTFSS
jgi:hypothetical protein